MNNVTTNMKLNIDDKIKVKKLSTSCQCPDCKKRGVSLVGHMACKEKFILKCNNCNFRFPVAK